MEETISVSDNSLESILDDIHSDTMERRKSGQIDRKQIAEEMGVTADVATGYAFKKVKDGEWETGFIRHTNGRKTRVWWKVKTGA